MLILATPANQVKNEHLKDAARHKNTADHLGYFGILVRLCVKSNKKTGEKKAAEYFKTVINRFNPKNSLLTSPQLYEGWFSGFRIGLWHPELHENWAQDTWFLPALHSSQ